MNAFLHVFSIALAGCGAVAGAYAAEKAVGPPPVLPPVGAKIVSYGERDVVPISTKVRFTTMIELPKNEQILDFICGDKEFWVVNGAQNFAFVKPARAGSDTNLNLITASGNVYSFVLHEVGDGQPDLKVFVEPRDSGFLTAANGSPRFVPASAVDDWKAQADLAREQARKVRETAEREVAAAKEAASREKDAALAKYPQTLRTNYRFKANDSTFHIEAIYRDDRFTYIRAKPQEAPSVYEEKDGRPSPINFQLMDGVYTLDKVVSNGYLAIGTKKIYFHEE